MGSCCNKVKYTNPKLPEGINTSEEHPLKEFALLTTGVLGMIVIIVILLGFMADKLAVYIPFQVETRISTPEIKDEIRLQPINQYLDNLTIRISQSMELPEDMDITVHYVNQDIVNAFATLGGHIVMFRGLLEKLPNENALAMVLAHEIAHVRYRHPIRNLGRGVAIGLVFTFMGSSAGDKLVSNILGEMGYLTALTYNRDQENEADIAALDVMEKLYGHVDGTDMLFQVLKKSEKSPFQYEFFNSHPLTEKRIQRIKDRKYASGSQHKKITQLPEKFKSWVSR